MNDHTRSTTPPPKAFSQRQRNWLPVTGLLFLLVVLFLVGSIRWLVEQGFVLGVTPTVTPTPRTTRDTPTADFRATRNAAEFATQQAQQLALIGVDTPTPEPSATPTAPPTATPTLPGVPTVTPTERITVVVPIPIVGVPGSATDTPTPEATDSQTPEDSATVETPPVTPDETVVVETDTPTPSPTNTPTVTPELAAQATITLKAMTWREAAVFLGPSSLYTQTTSLPSQRQVILGGRDASGEWIYLCCEENVQGWTRQANLEIRDNELPPGAPPNGTPDDARWLLEQQPTVTPLTPLPARTPIPPGDYPLLRWNPEAQANLDHALQTPLQSDWLQPAQAAGALSSPVVVVGANVIVASQDQHLYSFDKETGNQRWRKQLGQQIRHASAVQDSDIYVVDNIGNIFALRVTGNSASDLWSQQLPTAPSSAPNLWSNILLIPGTNNRLYARNRLNGDPLWEVETPAGGSLQYPVVGGQMVYVGNRTLRALDLYRSGETVWEDTRFNAVSAPPVYGQPGVLALAEVYAADSGGNIYAFDANTGRYLWTHPSGEQTQMMALDESTLYASGNSFAKAIDRRNGQQIWRSSVSGDVAGGPIVSRGRVIVVTVSGTIHIFDAFQGTQLFVTSIPSSAAGAPAASEGRLFVSSTDGNLYAFREGN